MNQKTWGILIVVSILTVSGCARLPAYAEPKLRVIDDDTEDAEIADAIPYRKLQRADFRGTQPPHGFDERMAAVTCIYTKPVIDKRAIDVQPDPEAQLLQVTLHKVRYLALMSQSCSWWNPDTNDSVEDYVLEHEQIHFALSEIAARRWSEASPIRFQVKTGSPEIVSRDLKTQFDRHFQEKMRELQARNLKFDEETSYGNVTGKHQEWLTRVRTELALTIEPEPTDADVACEISESALSSIMAATLALESSGNNPQALKLVQQAKEAARSPECDSVRAKTLADQAIGLIEGSNE